MTHHDHPVNLILLMAMVMVIMSFVDVWMDMALRCDQMSWRGEVDLHSLSRERLEAYLRERGITAPPAYR